MTEICGTPLADVVMLLSELQRRGLAAKDAINYLNSPEFAIASERAKTMGLEAKLREIQRIIGLK